MASPRSVHTERDEAAVFCLLTDNDSEMTESEAIVRPASADNLNAASNDTTITTMIQSGIICEKTHSQSVNSPTSMLHGDEYDEEEEDKEKEEGSELLDGEDIRVSSFSTTNTSLLSNRLIPCKKGRPP